MDFGSLNALNASNHRSYVHVYYCSLGRGRGSVCVCKCLGSGEKFFLITPTFPSVLCTHKEAIQQDSYKCNF